MEYPSDWWPLILHPEYLDAEYSVTRQGGIVFVMRHEDEGTLNASWVLIGTKSIEYEGAQWEMRA